MSLCDGASALEPSAPKRALVRDALDFLIYEQFIKSRYLPGRTWRVVTGSGMGLTHSSAVVDSCLFTLAEKDWAARADVQVAHGVKMFVRIRDDIFIVTSDLAKFRVFFAKYQQLASSVFTMAVIGVSRLSVDMLAVTVVKRGCCLVSAPRVRELQGPPLSPQTVHPFHVHKSWPVACLRLQRKLCCSEKDFKAVRDLYVSRFRQSHASDQLIANLQMVTLYRSHKLPLEKRVWIVLDYHPAFEYSCISRRVRQFLADPHLYLLWKWSFSPIAGVEAPLPVVGIAWRNVFITVAASVQRC